MFGFQLFLFPRLEMFIEYKFILELWNTVDSVVYFDQPLGAAHSKRWLK